MDADDGDAGLSGDAVHAAVHKNYFKEVGIEVDVQHGQAGDYNHNQLLAGQAQFASIDASGPGPASHPSAGPAVQTGCAA